MTATVTAATGRPSRQYGVIVALTLSLALNLCFVAGVVWTRVHAPAAEMDPAEQFQEMARQLNLDPQQRVAFERYFRTMRARTQLMREEVEPRISDAWSEIAKPQADEAQVMRLFDEAAEKRRAFQREVTSQTLAFLTNLSPEQRAKFVELARERRALRAQRIRRDSTP